MKKMMIHVIVLVIALLGVCKGKKEEPELSQPQEMLKMVDTVIEDGLLMTEGLF